MSVIESSQAGGGTPNVHQYGAISRGSFPVASGSQVYDGDLVYLRSGTIKILSGASTEASAFLGVANGTSPTQDMYGNTRTPNVVVLEGGVAKLGCASTTWTEGSSVYIDPGGANVVNSSANGSAIGYVTSPPGTSDGNNYYANAVTTVYVQLKTNFTV